MTSLQAAVVRALSMLQDTPATGEEIMRAAKATRQEFPAVWRLLTSAKLIEHAGYRGRHYVVLWKLTPAGTEALDLLLQLEAEEGAA